jgi:hypothetical protein
MLVVKGEPGILPGRADNRRALEGFDRIWGRLEAVA